MPSYIQRHKTRHFHSAGNAWFLLVEALPQSPVNIMFWATLPFGHRLRNWELLPRNQSLFAYQRLSEYCIGVNNRRNDLYADSTSPARINEMAKSSIGNHDRILCTLTDNLVVTKKLSRQKSRDNTYLIWMFLFLALSPTLEPGGHTALLELLQALLGAAFTSQAGASLQLNESALVSRVRIRIITICLLISLCETI